MAFFCVPSHQVADELVASTLPTNMLSLLKLSVSVPFSNFAVRDLDGLVAVSQRGR